MKTSTTTKSVTGKARWVTKPDANLEGGVLRITTGTGSHEYHVRQAGTGWVLTRTDDGGKSYRVRGEKCDCPDARYRERTCKHAKALRAALDRLRLESYARLVLAKARAVA